jgi:hypothetical protein
MENQQEQELTQEELAERKEAMLSFYVDSVPYLEAQFKYETLLMQIDEARFKRSTIQMQYAMMMQSQKEQEEQEESEETLGSDHDIDKTNNIPEQGNRKLKTQ